MSSRATAKKTLRNFHARNGLWESYERKAKEMDCSVDYLINEAMRLYASTNGFPRTDDEQRAGPSPALSHGPSPIRSTDTSPPPPPPSAVVPRPPVRPSVPLQNRPTSIPKSRMSASSPGLPRPVAPPGAPPMRPSRPMPSAAQRPSSAGLAGGESRPTLTLVFQGRKIPILGEQFIIGRGSKSSDLAIKDTNISRKHAAVIFHNGSYYLKDLGSTNGIEYKNKSVDSKRIDEGDVFNICGYDLHFTYSD